MKTEIRAQWSHAVLVCAKCQKKANGPRLSKELRRAMGAGKGRKGRVGIVEVPCLDICPKKAVVVVDTRSPGVWRLVTPDADIDALAAELSSS